MAKKSNKSKPSSLYKHSFGHFCTEALAKQQLILIQEKHPEKKVQVVLEKRQTKYWKKYCVCEFIPGERKKDQEKSNKG